MEIDIKFKEPPRADEDIGKKRLTIELVDENDVTHKPKEYLNTFRYKIFCGTIAIGVALASRKNSGMNIPLILDDEFFASDIINRAEFENYFRQIILMYRKITPSMPFQFILFTHDELIFTSAREAIENVWANIQELNEKEPVDDLNEYWKSPIVDRTFFARLFPPKEAADEPKNLRTGEKYWDLIYKFEF